MARKLIFWVPLMILALLGGIAIYGLVAPKDDFVHSALVGQKLPAFELPPATEGVEGISSTSIATGKPRLLNLFGSWCAPCIAEAPQLEALKQAGVQIDGIALRDTPEAVARFLTQNGNPYARIGNDPDWRMPVTLGSTGVPETYVIAGDGRIIYQHIGEIRAEHVPMLLKKLEQAQ